MILSMLQIANIYLKQNPEKIGHLTGKYYLRWTLVCLWLPDFETDISEKMALNIM
jgi:hypothetical protein